MSRKKWLRLIQVALTLALIGWLALHVEWVEFVTIGRSLRWEWLVLAAAFVLASHFVNIMRWRYLVLPDRVEFRYLLSYYGAGIFSNNFLPTGIGGDGVRVALLGRHIPLRRALFTVACDRLVGLLGLSAFILPGLWLGVPEMVVTRLRAINVNWLLAAVTLFAVGGGSVLLLRRQIAPLDALITRILYNLTPPLEEGVSRWSYWLRMGIGSYLFSVLSITCLVVTHAFILLALNLEPSISAAIWLVVLGSLSMLLPLTINGLGIMESIYVLVLGNYHVSPPAALSVALGIRMLIIVFSLIGGLVSMRQDWLAYTARQDIPPLSKS